MEAFFNMSVQWPYLSFLFQVQGWISTSEKILQVAPAIPNSLYEAEKMQLDHQQFETALEVSVSY